MINFKFWGGKDKKNLSNLELEVTIDHPQKTAEELFDLAVEEVYQKRMEEAVGNGLVKLVFGEEKYNQTQACKEAVRDEYDGQIDSKNITIIKDRYPLVKISSKVASYSYAYLGIQDSIDQTDLIKYLAKQFIQEQKENAVD